MRCDYSSNLIVNMLASKMSLVSLEYQGIKTFFVYLLELGFEY